MRLLLVDDDEMLRSIVGEYLSDDGYQVDLAADGADALAMIEKKKYDAVVSDWEMPRMDGPALCRVVRHLHDGKDILFIMLTGQDSPNAEAEARGAGVDVFLHKPCDRADLVAALHKAEPLAALQHYHSAGASNAGRKYPGAMA